MIRPEKRTVTYEEWLFDLPINGKEMYDILHQALAEWATDTTTVFTSMLTKNT